MAKAEKFNPRDLVYEGLANAIMTETGVEKVERVGQGLKLNVNGEDVIIRAIMKKEPVTEKPKQVYTKTG